MEKVQADVIKKKKIDTKNLTENLLVIFVILCPVFDILSFVFRNTFNTNLSPSTILRPIIPLIAIIDLFIKNKHKIKMFIIAIIYGVYALVHLLLFNTANTGFSYSNVVHEMQYIMNYTFMIIILFVYAYVFKDKEKGKFVRKERYSGECSRSFYVGENVTENEIKAKFKNGTLTIEIPKKEEKKELPEKKYIPIE